MGLTASQKYRRLVGQVPVRPETVTNPPRRIFQSSKDGEPGMELQFLGAFTKQARLWANYGTMSATPRELKPIAGASTQMRFGAAHTVDYPAAWPKTLVKVWVQDFNLNGSQVVSEPVYINRASPSWVHSKEIFNGSYLCVLGRALAFSPSSFEAWLKPKDAANGTAEIPLTVVASDPTLGVSDHRLVILRMPTAAGSLANIEYDLFLYNGLGLKTEGTVKYKESLQGITNRGDSLNLGDAYMKIAPWLTKCNFGATRLNILTGQLWNGTAWAGPNVLASDLANSGGVLAQANGTTDCAHAMEAAFNYLQNYTNPNTGIQGGVVWLPGSDTKRYKINSYRVRLRNRVVMSGDPGVTIFTQGNAFNGFVPTITCDAGLYQSGMFGLNYENLSDTSHDTPWANIVIGGTELLFLNNRFDLNQSSWNQMKEVGKMIIAGNTVSHGEWPKTTRRGPWIVEGSSQLMIYNNITNYCLDGAWNIGHCSRYRIWKNTMNWDADKGDRLSMLDGPDYVVNHFLPSGGGRFGVIEENTFNGLYQNYAKDMHNEKNWGEAVLYERPGGPELDNQCGIPTGWGPLYLEESGRSFADGGLFNTLQHGGGVALFIVAGKGFGQIREIVGGTNTRLNIDREWDIIPDATSQYVACSWTAQEIQLVRNRYNDTKRAILFYWCTGDQILVDGEEIWNGGPVDYSSKQNGFIANKNVRCCPLWNVDTRNVKVDVSTDNINGTTVGQHIAFINNNVNFGVICANYRYWNMEVKAKSPTQRCRIDADFWPTFNHRTRPEGQPFSRNVNVPAMLNMSMNGNKLYNCQQIAHLTSGNVNMLIRNTGVFNTPDVLDQVLNGSTGGSQNFLVQGTYSIPDKTVLTGPGVPVTTASYGSTYGNDY